MTANTRKIIDDVIAKYGISSIEYSLDASLEDEDFDDMIERQAERLTVYTLSFFEED